MILDSLLKQAINNFDKKKFEKSIELFEKILEKEPNNSEIITMSDLAYCYKVTEHSAGV